VTSKSVSDLELNCAFNADLLTYLLGVKRAKSSFAFEEWYGGLRYVAS